MVNQLHFNLKVKKKTTSSDKEGRRGEPREGRSEQPQCLPCSPWGWNSLHHTPSTTETCMRSSDQAGMTCSIKYSQTWNTSQVSWGSKKEKGKKRKREKKRPKNPITGRTELSLLTFTHFTASLQTLQINTLRQKESKSYRFQKMNSSLQLLSITMHRQLAGAVECSFHRSHV